MNKTAYKEAAWVGLYQDPGTFYERRGWENWHRGGCNSIFRNWEEGEPDDYNDMQQACAAVFLSTESNKWANTYKWYDVGCGWKLPNGNPIAVQCVCQEDGERDDAFDEDTQKKLLAVASIYQTEVGFSFTLIFLLTALMLIAYGIYTFRKMSHTKERRSNVAFIIFFFMSYAVTLILRFLTEKEARDALVIILPISVISMLSILITEVFSLLDSIIIAIGGVREAKKSWIKRIRQFISFFAILALIGASFLAKNYGDKYSGKLVYVFSDFMLAFSSIFFIGVAVVFLSLFVIFSVESNSNI